MPTYSVCLCSLQLSRTACSLADLLVLCANLLEFQDFLLCQLCVSIAPALFLKTRFVPFFLPYRVEFFRSYCTGLQDCNCQLAVLAAVDLCHVQ